MVSVIIVAAGKGTRMKSDINKQFMLLGEKPVLLRTIEKFLNIEAVQEIIVVLNKHDKERFLDWNFHEKTDKIKIAEGGAERYLSVQNGLQQVDALADIILVHDGARPFVTATEIEGVIEMTRKTGACILACKVQDTIKQSEEGVVVTTLDRSNLYAVKTPQGFFANILKEVYLPENITKFDTIPTDDSSLVEKFGYKVHVVEGNSDNIKITTPMDLLLGELLLKKEENSCE